MTKIVDFLHGILKTFDDNESHHRSDIADPCKARFSVRADKVESNLGAISFDLERADGSGELDEQAYLMGRLTADKQAGAVYVAVRHRGEHGCREVLYLDQGQLISRVPIFAPNLGSNPGSLAPPNELVSPSDVHRMSLQDDGSIVVYRMGPDGRGTAVGVVQVRALAPPRTGFVQSLMFWK